MEVTLMQSQTLICLHPWRAVLKMQESVKEMGDGGILDHTTAKLLPVVTTLRTHLDPSLEGLVGRPCPKKF